MSRASNNAPLAQGSSPSRSPSASGEIDPPASRPLILTLGLDPENQARFERERRQFFPARLNRIPAHINLFHALPGADEAAIRAVLAQHSGSLAPFALHVADLMRLGRGVAYTVAAPELDHLHAQLRARWLPALSRQDLQPFRLHVVVQNKAIPEEARTLYTRLDSSFRPWTAMAERLLLWRYEGGPWTALGEFPFAGSGGAL